MRRLVFFHFLLVLSMTGIPVHAEGSHTARFGTVINCIDGRVQNPVSAWIRKAFHVDYVDTITEPGPDKLMSSNSSEEIEAIKRKVLISIKAHGSRIVAVAGHYDCAANPVSKQAHWNEIKQSEQMIRSWNLPVTVVGLWVTDRWNVEEVQEGKR